MGKFDLALLLFARTYSPMLVKIEVPSGGKISFTLLIKLEEWQIAQWEMKQLFSFG
jgi:hypothetical protein